MADISNKKKLNIWQRFRLQRFLRKGNWSLISSAPEYIKNSPEAISRIIDEFIENQDAENEWEDEFDTPKNFVLNKINNDYSLVEVLRKKGMDNPGIFDTMPDGIIIRFLTAYPEGINIVPESCYKEIASEILDNIIKKENISMDILNILLKQVNSPIEFILNNPSIIEKLDKKSCEDILKDITEEQLEKLVNYLNDDLLNVVLKNNPEYVSLLPNERKKELITQKLELLHYAEPEWQSKFITENPEHVKFALFTVQDQFIEENPKENFRLANEEYQRKKILENPSYYEYATEQFKRKIFFEKDSLTIVSILSRYPEEAKYIVNDKECVSAILERMSSLDLEQTKNICLHTKFASPGGHIKSRPLHDRGEDLSDRLELEVTGFNSSSFTEEQLIELIKTDVNYILCITDWKDKEYESKIERCCRIFSKLYEDNAEIMKNSEEFHELIKNLMKDKCRALGDKPFYIEELKILFNSKITENNTTDSIREYIEQALIFGEIMSKYAISERIETLKKMSDYELGKLIGYNLDDRNKFIGARKMLKEKFSLLIKNAYGDKAAEILESRPMLDVHTINSLEVFDERILENFPLEVVHDFLTYNFEGFSVFLNIVKEPNRLEKFEKYFNILSGVQGQTAATMQKAIFEFEAVEELLDQELLSTIQSKTESEQDAEIGLKLEKNLLSAICSGNVADVRTLEDIEHYDKKIEKLLNNKNVPFEIICNALLGITDKQLSSFMKIFIISEEDFKKIDMTEEEKNAYESMKMLMTGEIEDIRSFFEEVGTIHPLVVSSTIRKIQIAQSKRMSETFLTREKMDQAIEEDIKNNPDTPMEERQIYKVEEKDGTITYHLNGYAYAFLYTKINIVYDLSLEEYLHLDTQGGNSAICSRYTNSELYDTRSTFEGCGPYLIYTRMFPEEIIGVAPGRRRRS